ncbi:MAG TPA: ABC transporter permease [Burkholderiales bacterium]
MKTAQVKAAQAVAAAGQERKARARRLTGVAKWLPLVLILVVWELGSGTFIDPLFFSKPSTILQRLIEGFRDGSLTEHTYATLYEIFGGYLLGVIIGGTLGYLSGVSPRFSSYTEPYVLLLNAVPKVAIAPIIVVWFGIGLTSKVVLASLMVFFVVFFNVFLGIRSINVDYLHLARIMGASRRQVIWSVVLPSIAPFTLTALKQGVVFAVIGAIIAEFIAAARGVGYYIQMASGMFDTAGVFAGVLILLAVVVVATGVFSLIEKRYLRWYHRNR